ncbi:MAG: thiamine pyrophosphate-dependent enzyme, partial [Armatimonadaceae bacterium]
DPDEAQKVELRSFKSDFKVHPMQVRKAAELITAAHKPVLYVGGGAKAAGAHDEIFELARQGNIPVTTTLHGLGTFPEDNPLSLGMLGMHGTAYANYAVHNADLLIAVGARFDDRVTGKVSAFAPGAKVVHMDIDPGEINKVRKADVSIVGDCKTALAELLKIVTFENDLSTWHDEIGKWKAEFPLEAPDGTTDNTIHSEYVLRALANLTDHDAVFTTDVGQHQMWAAQHLGMRSPRKFITSGGLGTMGFGLPAAIGASFALGPDQDVWCITGDGSIQMCIQELIVASIYQLPVKIVILNNQFLGMVRQWQEMFWQKHYSAVDLERAPDFVKLAEAYQVPAFQCTSPTEVDATLRKAIGTKGPVLLDFRVAKETCVFPMIPSGQTIHDMVVRKPENPADAP